MKMARCKDAEIERVWHARHPHTAWTEEMDGSRWDDDDDDDFWQGRRKKKGCGLCSKYGGTPYSIVLYSSLAPDLHLPEAGR